MDSNSSNSENNVWPKHEYDSDVDEELKICSKPHWNSENTMKLIKTLERDCKELWDTSHPLVKVRSARQAKLEFLANLFTTSPEEINRKIHNLRTQFNNELRKIKRRQCGPEGSGWEYFDSLMFMQRAPLESLGITGPVNLELAESQANEEQIATVQSDLTSNSNSKTHPGTAPYHDIPGNGTEPSIISSSHIRDECQIFGNFVASELRMLPKDKRGRLKLMIQRSILQVAEELV